MNIFSMIIGIIRGTITRDVMTEALKAEIQQMADYLVEKKGYPNSTKDLISDLTEAFTYAIKNGK